MIIYFTEISCRTLPEATCLGTEKEKNLSTEPEINCFHSKDTFSTAILWSQGLRNQTKPSPAETLQHRTTQYISSSNQKRERDLSREGEEHLCECMCVCVCVCVWEPMTEPCQYVYVYRWQSHTVFVCLILFVVHIEFIIQVLGFRRNWCNLMGSSVGCVKECMCVCLCLCHQDYKRKTWVWIGRCGTLVFDHT